MERGDLDVAVRAYIDEIDPAHRALFDRMHGLIMEVHPDARVVMSYKIPTYVVGRRRIHVGVWRHGVSLYGGGDERVAEFTARHPHLRTGKGTIQLRPEDAAGITDDEMRDLIRATLDPGDEQDAP